MPDLPSFPPSVPPLRQACAVPYRREGERYEVCLITSISKGRWSLPKGIIEADETPEQAALKETYEEAGLRGTIEGSELGTYLDYKWDVQFLVTGYLLCSSETLDDWPERDVRRREWVSLEDATERLCRAKSAAILAAAIERLTSGLASTPA